jgi:cephalosporin hydroxylase
MRLRNFLGRCYRNLFAPLHFRASAREFHELRVELPDTPQGWIDVTERYRGRGWFTDMRSWQVHSELLRMFEHVKTRKPTVVLEIGTAKGATLLGWCRIASKKVVSVDLPGGIHGGGYPAVKQRLYREFVSDRPEVSLHLIQADSHSSVTRACAEVALAGDKIDVLFIDGDHTYAGVKADFDLWSPLVRPGGLVIFHDILPHKHVAGCEVDRLWGELKTRFPAIEFVENPEQGWAGIGVIEMIRETESIRPC